MKKLSLLTLCIASTTSNSIIGAETSEFSITPVALNSENNNGSALGLKYELNHKFHIFEEKNDNNISDDNNTPINAEEVENEIYGKTGYLQYAITGSWTVDKKENPLTTSTAKIEGGYGDFQNGYEFIITGFTGLEGNQDYSNKNKVYGIKSGGIYSFDKNNRGRFIDLTIAYEQVDASEDDERMAITNDDKFNRLSGEFHANYKLKNIGASKTSITSLQLNYKYYKELDAPITIQDNNTDVLSLTSFVIKFSKGFYAAYSTGSLPFDKKDNKIFEVGFSQTLF